jgi:DNA-binding response OmpR family regulator
MIQKKILIVDDEPNLRELYRGELAEAGYDVETVSTGEEALAVIEEAGPDLVTLDVRMPGMGGIETLREIRELSPGLPVIMLTAYPEYKSDFDVMAADAYVVKSSNVGPLIDKVRFILGERKKGAK